MIYMKPVVDPDETFKEILTENYFGDLASELLKGSHMIEFVEAGSKNYG